MRSKPGSPGLAFVRPLMRSTMNKGNMNKNWYAKTTNAGSPHEQGLIADEKTGKSIAISYDPKGAALLAAAPDLLAANVSASESLKHFIETNLWPSGVCAADVYSILKEAEIKAGGKS